MTCNFLAIGGDPVLAQWQAGHADVSTTARYDRRGGPWPDVVAVMIEGAMRHGTTMDAEANHTDDDGQSKSGSASRGC